MQIYKLLVRMQLLNAVEIVTVNGLDNAQAEIVRIYASMNTVEILLKSNLNNLEVDYRKMLIPMKILEAEQRQIF